MTPEKILELARGQIGVKEATGRNDGIPHERYFPEGAYQPWCGSFCRWLFKAAGIPLPGAWHLLPSVTYMEAQLIKAGAYVSRDNACPNPEPGDIIFFRKPVRTDKGAFRHVGVVESLDTANGVVMTIEGNTANSVARRKYELNDPRIAGYARWRGKQESKQPSG